MVDPTVGDVENAAAEKNAPSREREDDKDTASDAASGDVDAPPPVPPRATPEASGGGKVLEDPGEYYGVWMHLHPSEPRWVRSKLLCLPQNTIFLKNAYLNSYYVRVRDAHEEKETTHRTSLEVRMEKPTVVWWSQDELP